MTKEFRISLAPSYGTTEPARQPRGNTSLFVQAFAVLFVFFFFLT